MWKTNKFSIGFFYLISWAVPSFFFLFYYGELFFYIPFIFLPLLIAILTFRVRIFSRNIFYFLFFIFYFLFFISSIVSSIFSPAIFLSFKLTILYFAPGFFVFLLFFCGIDKRYEELNRILWFILLIGVGSSVYGFFMNIFSSLYIDSTYGLIQVVSVFDFYLVHRFFEAAGFNRISGFFFNPNEMGVWIFSSIAILLYFIEMAENKKLLWFILLIVLVFGLFGSFSRSAILSVAVYFLLFYCLLKKYFFVLSLFFSALFFSGVFFLLTDFSFSEYLGKRSSLDLNNRSEIWHILIAGIYDNPVLGVGVGNSTELILLPAGVLTTAHNLYLQIISEIGFLGFFFFMFFYLFPGFYIFKGLLFKSDLNNKDDRVFLVFLFSWWFSFSIHQFFEGILFRVGFFSYYWLYIMSFVFFKVRRSYG